MKFTVQLLELILTNYRHRAAMAAVIRAVLIGGPRTRNVLDGFCENNRDKTAATIDVMLALDMLVTKGERRGTTYDLSPSCRRAALQLPELNPA